MQLTELLGLPVRDGTGDMVGTVVDVRLAVAGDLQNRPSSPELFGLIVSPRTGSSYLGYERSDARRPRVLAALLRWRHRGTYLVLWADIARVEIGRVERENVVLRAHFTRYSPVLRSDAW